MLPSMARNDEDFIVKDYGPIKAMPTTASLNIILKDLIFLE
jgi:hypothetical protein